MNNIVKQLRREKEKIGSWGNLVKPRIEAILKYAGKRILDAGCSKGTYVRFLCERSYDAYGFDLLPDENWQGKYSSRFKVADICNIPYKDNSFDTVVSFEVLEHIKNIDVALKELYRVTRKNIIISVPDCAQPEVFRKSGLAFHHQVDPTHKQMFTKSSIKHKLKENGFSIDVIKNINPIYPEILFLSSWYVPIKIADFLGHLANKLPFKRKYNMTLLVVASKIKDEIK